MKTLSQDEGRRGVATEALSTSAKAARSVRNHHNSWPANDLPMQGSPFVWDSLPFDCLSRSRRNVNPRARNEASSSPAPGRSSGFRIDLPPSLPRYLYPVAISEFVPGYSDGLAPEFHRLPEHLRRNLSV